MSATVHPPFDLLQLQSVGEHQFQLTVRSELSTPFGFLYGGSGIAACVEAAERAVGRPLQWITTQFVGSPVVDEIVDLAVVIPAHGKVTSQCQVFGTVAGRPAFTALCAHTDRPAGDGTVFLEMPEVPAPDDCPPMMAPFAVALADTFFDHLERRMAAGAVALEAVNNPQRGLLAMWCRIPGGTIGSPATQAFVADIVPLAVSAALGVVPGGTSLDNTLRVIDTEPSEWVLLDITAEGFHRSIGHGSLRLWSQDGRLLGIGQQSCIIRTSHHTRR